MKNIIKAALFILLVCVNPTPVLSATLDAYGHLSETVNTLDLIGGAGSALIDFIESVANLANLDYSGLFFFGFAQGYRVDIKKIDGTWNSNLHLYVKRTGTGIMNPIEILGNTISGGTSYQEVTDTNQSFYTGAGGRLGVPLQFRMTGLSLQIPPGTYRTTVTVTIVEI